MRIPNSVKAVFYAVNAVTFVSGCQIGNRIGQDISADSKTFLAGGVLAPVVNGASWAHSTDPEYNFKGKTLLGEMGKTSRKALPVSVDYGVNAAFNAAGCIGSWAGYVAGGAVGITEKIVNTVRSLSEPA